jgi:cobalt-zinc-cadmium efflux system membrane fusion protein
MKNILYILISIIFISCGDKSTPSKETTIEKDETIVQLNAAQKNTISLETFTTGLREMSPEISVNGKIELPPQNEIYISFPIPASVKKINVLPGEKVRKGQTLAIVQHSGILNLQQEYLSSQSKVLMLEAEYNRQHKLNSDKTGSDKIFEKAKNEFEIEKLRLKSLSESLSLIGINSKSLSENNLSSIAEIKATTDGFISKVSINTGQLINESNTLFEIIDDSDTHLVLYVFENDLHLIKEGMTVRASTTSLPNELFEAKVHMINRNLDDNHNAELHCHFAKKYKDLIPGMTMKGKIASGKRMAIAVPSESVRQHGNDFFVFIEESNLKYRKIQVTTGVSENGYTELMSSETIKEGIKVVSKGSYALLSKLLNKTEE